ncbi:MAG: hypothetical protein KF780_10945 [Sphingomonas sp.]|nr:hypothetical protein [Sphingomonas sp.]
MSFVSPYADEAEEYSESNYVVRHWRGHLSLPISYWVNGSILFIVTAMVGNVILLAISNSSSLRAIAIVSAVLILLFVVMRVWAVVGIWRSAGRHVARGGAQFWATAARTMVVLGVLGSGAQLRDLWLQFSEFAQLAAGSDPIGEPARLALARDGRDLVVHGNITQGIAGAFRQMAADAPGLERVVLSSPGGRVFEAERMAELIRARGLATHVDGECASACTMLLLAGVERTAGRNSAVGFHRVAFPGTTPAEDNASNDEMTRYYLSAGLPRDFVRRIAATSADDMWVPTVAELVGANVLTDARHQVEEILEQAVAEVRPTLPRRLDDITTFHAISAAGGTLVYGYRLDLPASAIDRGSFRREMTAQLSSEVCGNPGMAEIVTLGGRFTYSYSVGNGAPLADIEIDRCEVPGPLRARRR